MSATVVEYTIACEGNPVELAEAVNHLIAEGWRPHGSLVCVHSGDGYLNFYQALVK